MMVVTVHRRPVLERKRVPTGPRAKNKLRLSYEERDFTRTKADTDTKTAELTWRKGNRITLHFGTLVGPRDFNVKTGRGYGGMIDWVIDDADLKLLRRNEEKGADA